jgi:hypothetical protein
VVFLYKKVNNVLVVIIFTPIILHIFLKQPMAGLASINIKFRADLQGFSSEMQNAMRTIENAGKKMQAIGAGMTIGFTLPTLAIGKAAFDMASDFEESLNKVNVAFGQSSEIIREFAKTTLENYGIAEGTALDMAALYGDMATSMGLPQAAAAEMSKTLVGLAGDLASFKNIDISQAQTALNGVFTGETESLKLLGIVMTEANLAQFALSQGIQKNIKDFTQAEKVQLRYQYILENTKNSQGDFARTSDGAANQTRIFSESLKEIGQSIGSIFLPAITSLLQKVNGVLAVFKNMSPEFKKTIVVIAAIVAAIGPLIAVIGTLMTILPTIVAGVSGLGAVFAALTGPIGLVVLAIAGITVAIVKNWDTVKSWVRSIMQYFVDLYNESMIFRSSIQAVILIFKTLWEAIKYIANLIVDVFKALVRNVVTAFSSVGELVKAVLTGDFKAIPGIIKNAFKEGFGSAKMMFSEIAEDSKVFGKNVATNFSDSVQNIISKRKVVLAPETVKAEKAAEAVSNTFSGAVADGVEKGVTKGMAKAGEIIKRGQVSSALVDAPNISASANAFGDDKKTLQDFKNSIQAWQKYRNEVANTTEQLQYADAEIAKLQEKMQMLENGGVTAFGNIKLAVTSTFDAIAAYNERLAASLEEMNERINQAVENFLGNSLANIGDAIGAMFSGDSFDLGKTMLQTLAGLLRQLGEIAIQTGIGLLAIKKAFQSLNPAIAIGAGVALIAFSSLISNSIKDAGSFTNGGVVGGNSYYGDRLYARVNSGELILNQKQQASIWNGLNRSGAESFMGSLETKVKGEDLLIVLDRANKKKNRKG